MQAIRQQWLLKQYSQEIPTNIFPMTYHQTFSVIKNRPFSRGGQLLTKKAFAKH